MSAASGNFSVLKWYKSIGVDAAMQEEARDWRSRQGDIAETDITPSAQIKPRSETVSVSTERPHSSPAPVPDEHSMRDAEQLAANATSLEELRIALTGFDGCALKLRATQLVFGDGNPEADIMLIGEAPGRDEDEQGKPFVGRSGQLLDRMLAQIGLDRTKVYIANTVPWRPPGNRTPTAQEIAVCMPFLIRQVELVNPKIIVSLGAAATQTLRDDPKLSIVRTRGKWNDITLGAVTCPTLAMFHPAFLLRQPLQKREAWRDLIALQKQVQTLSDNQ